MKDPQESPSPSPAPDHPSPAPEEPKRGQPVLIYIAILFLAALLLMGFSSLLHHQRSNTETLGQLQHDLSAMQETQALQEKIISLQEERERQDAELEELRRDAESSTDALRQEKDRTEALNWLYVIQMEYLHGRYEACQEDIRQFDNSGLVKYLSEERVNDVVDSPAARYRQLKDGVEARLRERANALSPAVG